MIATLMLAAVQAAAPVPPAALAPATNDRTVVREIIIHEHRGDGKKAAEKGERQEIIVIRNGDRAPAGTADRRVRIVDVAPGKPGERREIRIRREPGSGPADITMLSCDDGSNVDSEATDKDGKKTRVMICAKGPSDVSRVQQLRDAAKRIAANTELSEETRNRITLAINEAIAKLPVSE